MDGRRSEGGWEATSMTWARRLGDPHNDQEAGMGEAARGEGKAERGEAGKGDSLSFSTRCCSANCS